MKVYLVLTVTTKERDYWVEKFELGMLLSEETRLEVIEVGEKISVVKKSTLSWLISSLILDFQSPRLLLPLGLVMKNLALVKLLLSCWQTVSLALEVSGFVV